MPPKEILIDTRELPSPEPMQRAVEALGDVNENSYIKMLHRMEPKMLFNVLTKNGFDFKISHKNESLVEIYIYSKKSKEIKEYIEGL